MSTRTRLKSLVAARDPAHARLVAALGVTTGMLLSALFGQFVIHELHAETGLLAMSIFLSVQAGNMVKDATARARLFTTALLIPSLVAAIAAASLLAVHRSLVIVGFILIAGAAIWVRRFGPRASAIGSLSFMGYFFTLFMKPAPAELPAFALVAAGAVAAQLLVRTALLFRRPRRELEVLLRELRAGSAAAVGISGSRAVHPQHGKPGHALRMALARLDDVGRAITTWQQAFQTDRHIAADEQTLAESVLDARVDTEEACGERAGGAEWITPAGSEPEPRPQEARAEQAFLEIVDERATPDQVDAASDVAQEILGGDEVPTVEAHLLARSALSHAHLRDIDLRHGLRDSHSPAAATASVRKDPSEPVETTRAADSDATSGLPTQEAKPRRRAVPWREWAPTSRMAVQVMIAATLAAGVGEAISASRWYWAVMTAFVIFIGATTRSSVLTRAYRRVAGTAIGIAVGLAFVSLAGSNTAVLVGICVVAVFGMLYLGPINYLYSATFITTMLVALYRMLGVLDGSILELRLIETVSGAVIGVLCAYLILSTNSRDILLDKVDSYFDALARLLDEVTVTPPVTRSEMLDSLHQLEAAQAALDQAVSSMSAAQLVAGPSGSHRQADAVHMMYVATRAAARLIQAQMRRPRSDSDAASDRVISRAAHDIERAASDARSALHGRNSGPGSSRANSHIKGDSTTPHIIESLSELPGYDVASRDAFFALARIEWALHRITAGASR